MEKMSLRRILVALFRPNDLIMDCSVYKTDDWTAGMARRVVRAGVGRGSDKTLPLMKQPRIDVRSIRRAQVVEAAVAVIAGQGLQNLSLSEIEAKAGMSRGQLTYYFPT